MCHGKKGKYCSQDLEDFLTFGIHFKELHKNFMCLHCNIHFDTIRELKCHMKDVHGIKRNNEEPDETTRKRLKNPNESDAHHKNQNAFEDHI